MARIEYLEARMAELHATAADSSTYLKEFDLIEEIEEELAWVRPVIAKLGRRVRRGRRKQEDTTRRWGYRWPGEEAPAWWGEWAERDEKIRVAHQAFRDELKAGLRELRKVLKERSERNQRLLDEWEAEKAAKKAAEEE